MSDQRLLDKLAALLREQTAIESQWTAQFADGEDHVYHNEYNCWMKRHDILRKEIGELLE